MKLYWRVKINGKWTWRPADVVDRQYLQGHEKYAKLVLEMDEDGR